ncbi:MAG TPA: hypothetical protein VG675_20855 [Bryobacteraceae bacterium]|nr:hypothetical protein [Bryobacteraceae bacterium]
MSSDMVRQIADAVLYEGYMLYPYRASSVKNRQRWTIGGLYPEPYVERYGSASSLQSQLLVESAEEPSISVTVRFLHLLEREDGFQEGIPRELGAGPFEFPAAERQQRVAGRIELFTEPLSSTLHRVTLRIFNLTASDNALAALAATHAILRVSNGDFISMTDTPEEFRAATLHCVNTGVWPVLAGDADSRACMLVSPIILYDYPQIAPESAGDLFDATEIDEILSLRILTLTDQEKEEIRATDSRTRRVLERTESLSPAQLMKLHGVLRSPRALAGLTPGAEENPFAEPRSIETVCVFGADLKRGDRVRLWPRKRSDIMDLALAGQVAEIESIEVDYEGCVHFAVVLTDDPGKDLGVLRQPGHRFFFSPEEVEPLALDGNIEAAS